MPRLLRSPIVHRDARCPALLPLAACLITAALGLGDRHAYAQPYTLTTLATFTGTNGSTPYAGLTLDGSGNLFGTTQFGGTSNKGTVFKIAVGTGGVVGGGELTTLATFNSTNGANPIAGLTLDSSGNLFGTTQQGGTSGQGTVFKIAAGTGGVVGGGALTTLATFNGVGNGANPYANLTLDGNGNLFGTTDGGGASNKGTVFKFSSATNTLTTLATFTGPNGVNPDGRLTLDSNGNLFGTTSAGGASGSGTVFKLTPAAAATAPEPGALLLLAPGALGLLAARRRRAG